MALKRITTLHLGSVLVIAAHPDDEILGCGGTMARLRADGHDIKIAILGEGVTARYRIREDADRCLLSNLREHSRRAADELGVKDVFLYDLPDNRFDTLPILDVVKIVEGLIQRHSPDTIFTHSFAADPERSIDRVRERADGTQFDSSDGRYLRAPDSRCKRVLRGPVGRGP